MSKTPGQEKFEAFYVSGEDPEDEYDSELCEYTGEECEYGRDKMSCEECPVVECPFSRGD